MKYLLIYILSFLLVSFIWYRGFEIPKRMEVREYYMDRPSTPQEVDNDTTVVYLERVPELTAPIEKSLIDYINEILSTVVGLINLIAFRYQMKDRKKRQEIKTE